MFNVTPFDDLSTQIERGNFHSALFDDSIDQTELYRRLRRWESRRRLQLTLAAMPEPTAEDIAATVLVIMDEA